MVDKCRPTTITRLMDCQKLSLEARTHAAENESVPLRTIVRGILLPQLQPGTSIFSCFLVFVNVDWSRQWRSGLLATNYRGWITSVRGNQLLKFGMDSMQRRAWASELEKEYSIITKARDLKTGSCWNQLLG